MQRKSAISVMVREDGSENNQPGGGNSTNHNRTSGAEMMPTDSPRNERGLAAISTLINNNLQVFRAGAMTMMIGSGLTVAFLLYRRGIHGYTCASQVPASVFERRARIRVRVAKITAAEPPTVAGAERASGDFRVGLDGKGYPPYQSSSRNESSVDGKVGQGRPSDVLLHAEHITLLRRALFLKPRSLFRGATSDSAATFTLRLCGVSAEKEGVLLACDELVKPLVGNYCDAELLFREQRASGPAAGSALGVIGLGFGGTQSSWPVAVCHIHRRRGVLWRDLIQPRLDPEAGFGEHLLSLGVARLRDEVWWGTDGGNASTIRGTEYLAVAGMGTGDSDSLPAVKRLLADRERLKAAEDDARERGRGLWAESPESRGRDVAAVAMEKDGDDNGQRRSRGKYWWVGRAILGLFRRG